MDMESSRRSLDRLRQLGVRKSLLEEKTDGDGSLTSRGILHRPAAPLPGLLPSRVRGIVRDAERDDLSQGDGYHPQHPHQELVIQYKAALAGLTFNSKPIINNLTIIAGENLQAAKAISSTICSHILEVPSEQKLPSLYLLDSIVKNIGRDYVKYFAARLPEIFCRAYRQVESSIRSSMRHLFGTWKGIFHQQALQMIEKELGFSLAANGSTTSSTTTSRSDSQSQQPPHSIHVNPKYLESRLHLQQSSRAKGMDSEIIATGDVERLERSPSISASKTWADLPIQMNNTDRLHAGNQASFEKRIGTLSFGDKMYSDVSTSSGLGIRRNGVNNEIPSYSERNSFNSDVQLVTKPSIESKSVAASGNWRNREMEEYIWDDINVGLKDLGTAGNIRKDRWTPDGSGKSDFETRPRKQQKMNDLGSKSAVMDSSIDSLSGTQNETQTTFPRNRNPLPWSIEEPLSIDNLSPLNSPPILPTPSEMKPTPPTDFKAPPQIPTPFKTRLPNDVIHKFDPKPSISLKKTETSSPIMADSPLNTGIVSTKPQPSLNPPILPISDLLSSLVVKGLISESPGPPILSEPQNQEVSDFSNPKPNTPEVESLIGFEFKPNVIREPHESVIRSLFNDFNHSCRTCGVRLRLEDQVEKHLEWHGLKKREPGSSVSRKWFVRSSEWVGCGVRKEEDEVMMVGADERQCVCIVCGEMFEDVYNLERDEWMFKDAVVLNVPNGESVIVHPNCVSQSFVRELGLALGVHPEEIRY